MKTAARWVLTIAVALAALAAIAMCQPAFGQTPPEDFWCMPAELGGTGTRYENFATAAVSGRIGWCPNQEKTRWKMAVHQWCRNDVCNRLPAQATITIAASIDRVLKASDKKTAVKAEWDAWKIANDTPLKEWEYKDWRYQACTWLTSTHDASSRPPVPIPLPKAKPDDVDFQFPLTFCDVLKPGDKPAPPPVAWRAAGGTLYKLTMGPPPRLVSATTRKATQNAACDPALVIPVGAKSFMRLAGGALDEATECVK